MELITLTIQEVIAETADTKTFVLKSDIPFTYKAGQFITLIFQKNGHELRRSYSFSSSPSVDSLPAITIKKVVNGEMSDWWMTKAKPGVQIKSLLPSGVFTVAWQPGTKRDIFLIAAGSGITPIYSLVKEGLIKEPESRFILIYSNSHPANAIFFQQIVDLEKQYPDKLVTNFFFSNSKNLAKARLSTYNLQQVLQPYTNTIKEALVYTCGPFNFMMMVQITCLTMGFIKNNIRREVFYLAPLVEEKKYFDTTNRTIELQYAGKTYTLLVPYQQTILDAALENGINLPYSCKAGRCSTCSCKLLSGKIWMHYNEVLTDADEENGIFLTCTGHPASDNVIINI